MLITVHYITTTTTTTTTVTTTATAATTTRYKQTLGPRSLYISLFVSTLKGTNKHWDPVVVI